MFLLTTTSSLLQMLVLQSLVGIITNILAYSDIIRHIQELFRHILNPVYCQHIQNPAIQNHDIFKTKGMFRTLVYSKLQHIQNQRHIQNPGLFRNPEIFRTGEAYSEPCQTSMMECFEKQLTTMIIFTSYNYFYQLFVMSSSS